MGGAGSLSGTGTAIYHSRTNQHNIYIQKNDAEGNILWSDVLADGYYFGSSRVAVDKFNNTFLYAGKFIGDDSTTLLVKYDTNGNKLWSKNLLLGWGVGGSDIFIDGSNIFAKESIGSASVGTNIYKYDLDGNYLSKITENTLDIEEIIFYKNYLYVTGSTDADYGNATSGDFFVAKYDKDLEQIWKKVISGVPRGNGFSRDSGRSLTIENDNIYIICGTYSLSFDGVDAGLSGWENGFLLKYDIDGNKKWVEKLDRELRVPIVASDSSSIYFSGRTLDHRSVYLKKLPIDYLPVQ